MKTYKITFEKPFALIIELRGESDMPGKQAIILESHQDIQEFLEDFGYVYQDSFTDEWAS